MFDVEKFIDCIHERPMLWDKSLQEYAHKTSREKSWKEIGEVMIDNWLDLGLQQRAEKVKEMKNKWRHIRDNFLKYINQENSGEPLNKKRKQYVYAEVLSFLLNSVKRKSTFENTPDDEAQESSEQDGVFLDASLSIEQLNTHATPKQEIITSQGEQNIIDIYSEAQEDDPDKAFLISILPDYKKLNYDEKLDFRLTCLQFFRDSRRKQCIRS